MIEKAKAHERKQQAARLREIRESSGMTQERFAEYIGLAASSYQKLERGDNQISLATLNKLNNKTGVSADYILYGKKRDTDQVWTDILSCSESDKMLVLIRLLKYFIKSGAEVFPLNDESSDKEILRLINNMR